MCRGDRPVAPTGAGDGDPPDCAELGAPTSVGKGAHGRVRSRTHGGVHSRWMSAATCTLAAPPETSFSPLLIVWLFPEKLVCLARAETGALMMRGYATRTCRNGACCIWGRSYLYFAFQLLLSIFSLSFPIVFLFEREGGATINVSGAG